MKGETQKRSAWNDIQFSDDVFDASPGIFYVPVTGAPDINEGFQTLQKHFLDFGEEFGKVQSDETA